MGLQDQQPEDIRADLAVSQEEAQFGSRRVINLSGGRTTTVVIPAGTRDGQELRLAGQGLTASAGGPAGDLILSVVVIASAGQRDEENYATERAFYPPQGDSASGYIRGEQSPGWPTPPAQGPSFASALPGAGRSNPPSQQAGSPQAYAGAGGYQSNPAYAQPSVPPAAQPYAGAGGYQSNPAYAQAPSPALPATSHYVQPSSPSALDHGAPSVPPPGPKRSGALILLTLAIVLALIVGSGLIFYLGYYQPNQAHTVATQTTQARITSSAQAGATGSAQVKQATANVVATSTAQLQATARAYQGIYKNATRGTPALNDALSTPSLTSLWDITVGNSTTGSCSFTAGSYHSTISTADYFQPCYALATNYSTFAYQVDMTITQGDEGGILLRSNSAHTKFYLFRIGVDGSFALYNYTNTQGSQATLLLTGSSNVIKGVKQANQITVVAQHTTMYFFVNQQYLGSSDDNAYSSGQIGVFAESAKNPTDVAFSNAKVWTL